MTAPIYKETLLIGAGPQQISGRVIAAGVDPGGEPCVWFIADGATSSKVITVPTGGEVERTWQHLSTFTMQGSLVAHVFVVGL